MEITPQIADALSLPTQQGLTIARVLKGAPAEKAGLHGAGKVLVIGNRQIPVGGDIIVAYDGQPATSAERFMNYIESKRPGDSVRFSINRNGQPLTIALKLEERPR